ncbi:hypothetical protein SAMN02745166_00989 [Prosthecobacter debontii]|uniref:RanBP2-type domain-containing protein n=1 Tax=Prosthecobacter debontii TaxID=48467 RepID=A0A1T4X3H6_9BACT|nr:hypothetical protein [Prosthecobacter debontii]SKA84203.1 hypothetical protein SAMN02745166_00989 [Prosthecobacter debontii]
MRRISHHPDLAVLGLQQSILAGAGIASFVLNGNSWWLANGEVSFLALLLGKREHAQNPLFMPELCLAEDEDYDEALTILTAYQASVTPGEDWSCPKCGAEVPGTFAICWQCS